MQRRSWRRQLAQASKEPIVIFALAFAAVAAVGAPLFALSDMIH
jgi:hypothetical protein